MTKRIFIIHGWLSHPQDGWQPWLKGQLEQHGFTVLAPQLPHEDDPRIHHWIPAVQQAVGTIDEQTYFIGHSMGCQAIVRYLETLPGDIQIGGAVFICDFFKRLTGLEDNPQVAAMDHHWLTTPLDFNKAKKHLPKSIAIFSDDDPYVPLDNQDDFRDKLGSEIVVAPRAGHFTVGPNGPKEVPLILECALRII